MKLLVALLVGLALQVVSPLAAQACACGGFVGDKQFTVQRETAIVELDGTRQTITMQFAADTAATKAAWVMPVPARAELVLGDAKVFDELERFTAPEYRDVEADDDRAARGDGTGAGPQAPGGVAVLSQATIGPYETAQLAGSDPAAVADWLKQNGFTLPANLEAGLKPYLAEGWPVVAMRLNATEGKSLKGVLPALRIRFDAPKLARPVYPMRLSGYASTPQALRLYVLSNHRMDANSPVPGDKLKLYFAGRNTAQGVYVTRYDGEWTRPERIKQDIEFTQAAADTPHREVVIRKVPRKQQSSAPVLWPILAGGAAALVVTGLLVWYIRSRVR